jgi:hypothetical protein
MDVRLVGLSWVRMREPIGEQKLLDRDAFDEGGLKLPASNSEVNFGLWCEVRAHSLRAVFGHFGVLAIQTVKHLGGRFRFAATATLLDFAT